jgi:hypothetical protein
LEWNSF